MFTVWLYQVGPCEVVWISQVDVRAVMMWSITRVHVPGGMFTYVLYIIL
jgi:hypothetical protein